MLLSKMTKGMVPKKVKSKKHIHASFKYQCKRIGLGPMKPKAQQGVVKNHWDIHNRPKKASGSITQDIHS
jgi:hypothetical protein